jgi:HlyD family secretion protein
VKTGLANWEYTEIIDGVSEGDEVVTSLDRAGVKAGVDAVANTAASRK